MYRPKPGEDEEEILRMQEEFLRQKAMGATDTSSTKCVRVKKKDEFGEGTVKNEKTVREEEMETTEGEESGKEGENFVSGVRFTIDLENTPRDVLFGLREKNVEFLDRSVEHDLSHFLSSSEYSNEDGFPQVMDLSAYYGPSPSYSAPPGMSMFAAEFDRLNGLIKESTLTCPSEPVEEGQGYEAENTRRIQQMSVDEVERAKQEIQEKLDPTILEFLKNRHRKSHADKSGGGEEKKASIFKRKANEKKKAEPVAPQPSSQKEDLLNNLEVLDEFANREDMEKYNRLAMDAVRLDLATKGMKATLPRQEQTAIRLFDVLRVAPPVHVSPLLDSARTRIDDIKQLYLEFVEPETGKAYHRFGHGLSPLTDSSWTLVPIRRVLDAVHARGGDPTEDDVDILRLALLWSVLLFKERRVVFDMLADPVEVFVRVAEIFLIGPAVFMESTISECASLLLTEYVLPAAVDGRLLLRLTGRVAGLDNFLPFYNDLLRSFDSWSMSDGLFSLCLLLPSYLSHSLPDMLQCRLLLWSPERSVARQMTLSSRYNALFFSTVKTRSLEQSLEMESSLFVSYAQLLGVYMTAIRDDRVTRDRNGALFELAADELGRFVKRHTAGENGEADEGRAKEFDALVEIVKASVREKLQL